MTTHLYDPLDVAYFDDSDARAERNRTFQICSDCRICVRLCPSFKDLFHMIDNHDDGAQDVRVLTDAQHTEVVDECYQCKLCFVICPYTPERGGAWKIDFPRLMLRTAAINARAGHRDRSARLLARTDLQGRLATTVAPAVNRLNDLAPARALIEKTTGIAKSRLLPTYARERFSKWFQRRPPADPQTTTVALFPTCMVEYQEPSIGKAVVAVYEHNGVACEVPDGQICCGMPWLDAGDTTKFEQHARHNVDALIGSARAGRDIVVPQPTCAYVLKNEIPDFLGTDDARLVAEHTFDVAEYLMRRHDERPLNRDFPGRTYETITWHAACHYRAQQIGPKSRDLMALTGADVSIVERCSAIDGTWGLRAENVDMAHKIAQPLMDAVDEASTDLIAGDCHLANNAIREATANVPIHPVQVLARAYGIERN